MVSRCIELQTSDDRGRGSYIGAIHLLTMIYIIYTMIGSNTPYLVSLSFCAISMVNVIDFDLIGRFKSIRIFIILFSLFASLNCYLKNELFGVSLSV